MVLAVPAQVPASCASSGTVAASPKPPRAVDHGLGVPPELSAGPDQVERRPGDLCASDRNGPRSRPPQSVGARRARPGGSGRKLLLVVGPRLVPLATVGRSRGRVPRPDDAAPPEVRHAGRRRTPLDRSRAANEPSTRPEGEGVRIPSSRAVNKRRTLTPFLTQTKPLVTTHGVAWCSWRCLERVDVQRGLARRVEG